MSNAIKTRVVGIDICDNITTFGVIDLRGTVLAESKINTKDYPDINDFVSILCERIIELVDKNGGYEQVRSVGVSAPSANFLTGCIENAVNFPWKGIIPLAAMMRDQLGLAVAVANDAHVTAIGEHVYGSAHGMKDFIVISLGHGGVGSCYFSNGVASLGEYGSAGEIGHTCVEENGRQCTCGRRGCLEEYASDRGILQTARELLADSQEPSLLRDAEALSTDFIAECFDKGDALAVEVYRRTGEYLGIGLAFYAGVINPEAIILTGSLSHDWQRLEQFTLSSFDEHVFPNVRGKCKIMKSIIADSERDVIGAGALAWEVEEYSLFK